LQILAFPSNEFGHQEPSTSECARSFLHAGVPGLTVFDITDVNGPAASEIFAFLQKAAAPFEATLDQPEWNPVPNLIKWNYYKFLLDVNGEFIPGAVFSSKQSPMQAEPFIRRALGLPPLDGHLLDEVAEAEPERGLS